MPGAEDYREAGRRCAALGEAVARIAALVGGWRVESHVAAGPVAAAVTDQLADVAADLRLAAGELDEIARECRRWR